jgi:hypothetical protein
VGEAPREGPVLLADGKIVERWQLADDLGAGQQLGVIPTPGQTPA